MQIPLHLGYRPSRNHLFAHFHLGLVCLRRHNLQEKHIQGDSIDFGPQKGGLTELQDFEDAVNRKLSNSAFKQSILTDWSLSVELTSYLCLPANATVQEVDIQVQVPNNFHFVTCMDFFSRHDCVSCRYGSYGLSS
jgi:hypothetical protein